MKAKHLCALLLTATLASCSSAPNPTVPTPSQPTPSQSVAANGYDYGFGTYYVATRRDVPANWGIAATWYANAQEDGFEVGDIPKKGAIAWTDEGQFGQVAIVENVSDDGTQVTITEMAGNGGWNRITTRTAPASAFKYIY